MGTPREHDLVRRAVADTDWFDFSLWTWCGQMSYYEDAPIQAYIDTMAQFEREYPGMRFIYYTGHGKRRRVSGEYRWYFGLRHSYRGEDGERSGRRRMYAEDFAQILSGLSSCHIHVVIDACYSGGFVEALKTIDGVESIHTSASSTEKAWSGAVDGASSFGMARVIAGRTVECSVVRRDRFERLLARCRAGNRDLNRQMVRDGMAVSFGGAYRDEEAAARRRKKGMWSGEFIRPQQWRRAHQRR